MERRRVDVFTSVSLIAEWIDVTRIHLTHYLPARLELSIEPERYCRNVPYY